MATPTRQQLHEQVLSLQMQLNKERNAYKALEDSLHLRKGGEVLDPRNAPAPVMLNPIPVVEGEVGGVRQLTVDARTLHQYLGAGRVFGAWIQERLDKYGFVPGVDFEQVSNLSFPNSESSKARTQTLKDYTLTLDTAKELAMVENNDTGRAVRRYFIELEKGLHRQPQTTQATFQVGDRVATLILSSNDASRVLSDFFKS